MSALLQLLGDGHDAIVQHTQRPAQNWLTALLYGGSNDSDLPIAPDATRRILRYRTAASMFATPDDRYLLRRIRGEQLQHAWACRGFKVSACRTVIPFRRRRAVAP